MSVGLFAEELPSLYEALKAEGYELPEETCDVSLEFPVDVARMGESRR